MIKKITNIDEIFDYLEKIDYLKDDRYMIYDYSYDSKKLKVRLENKEIYITFVFKDIIKNEFKIECTNGDGFKLLDLIFFEEKDGVFICEFNEEFSQRIFVVFKQMELIIGNKPYDDDEDIS